MDVDYCEHQRAAGECRWCDHQIYEGTCWYCAGKLYRPGVTVRAKPVHRKCKDKALKYLRDVG